MENQSRRIGLEIIPVILYLNLPYKRLCRNRRSLFFLKKQKKIKGQCIEIRNRTQKNIHYGIPSCRLNKRAALFLQKIPAKHLHSSNYRLILRLEIRVVRLAECSDFFPTSWGRLQSAPISSPRRGDVCRVLRFLPHGVGAFAEYSDFFPTAWARLQSALISSPRRGDVCRNIGSVSHFSKSISSSTVVKPTTFEP